MNPSTERPNIILINCDDLGYGDLGCYGSRANSTPYIDRLAEDGMRFTNFYMGASVCTPSRGAMLTGSYPRRIGFGSFGERGVLFPGDPMGLNPEETTISSVLNDQGYATKIVGKWHCGDQPEFLPTNHGFDSFYGVPYSNDMGRRRNHLEHPPLPLLRGSTVVQEQPDQASLTERFLEESVRFIQEHKDGPFFLYLAHIYVHLPLWVPKRFLERARNGGFGAAVECIDWVLGALLAELERLEIAGSTLVIFTSDNGGIAEYGGSNGALRGKKGTSWEGGHRVPCIMRWPGYIPAGSVCEQLTTAMDFLPTVARIVDATIPNPIDGRDIGPLLRGDPDAADVHGAYYYYNRDAMEAVRDTRYKLFFSRNGEPVAELYDVRADPGEHQNIFDQNPEVVAGLTRIADAMREEIGDSVHGKTGTSCRPVGRVDNARPLTSFDENHPYYMALYDSADVG